MEHEMFAIPIQHTGADRPAKQSAGSPREKKGEKWLNNIIMIKKIFCIICFCFLGLSLVFAKEEPLTIRINLIDKSGGSYQWFDIFHLGEVRYYHVQTEFTPTYFLWFNLAQNQI